MKGNKVSTSEWRTVQFFISATMYQVSEVQVNLDTNELKCDCNTFVTRKACKHTKFVKSHTEEGDGDYSIPVLSDVTDEEVELANESSATFRAFVIHNGYIEVL